MLGKSLRYGPVKRTQPQIIQNVINCLFHAKQDTHICLLEKQIEKLNNLFVRTQSRCVTQRKNKTRHWHRHLLQLIKHEFGKKCRFMIYLLHINLIRSRLEFDPWDLALPPVLWVTNPKDLSAERLPKESSVYGTDIPDSPEWQKIEIGRMLNSTQNRTEQKIWLICFVLSTCEWVGTLLW